MCYFCSSLDILFSSEASILSFIFLSLSSMLSNICWSFSFFAFSVVSTFFEYSRSSSFCSYTFAFYFLVISATVFSYWFQACYLFKFPSSLERSKFCFTFSSISWAYIYLASFLFSTNSASSISLKSDVIAPAGLFCSLFFYWWSNVCSSSGKIPCLIVETIRATFSLRFRS